MSDKFNMDRLSESDKLTSGDQQVGSFRTNSFFELYNNQNYIKNDLNNRKQSSTNSFNRSEEDEENLDCNLDDLNFDDLDDYGLKERNEFRSKIEIDISDEDDEELDKFDEEENNENHLIHNERLRTNFNNGIPINQRFNKNRSNSIRIDEEGARESLKDNKISHSLPVTIPYNHKTFSSTNIRNRHHQNQRDKDENWFSVKEGKGENIAESIKQLANSVRDDDYSLFGDLPSRKFNTSELIHSFK